MDLLNVGSFIAEGSWRERGGKLKVDSSYGTDGSRSPSRWALLCRCRNFRDRSRQKVISSFLVMDRIFFLTCSAPRCIISTQSNVLGFMRYNLQRRKYPDGSIALERVNRIIQWYFFEINDVPKVPADDERATIDGGDGDA